ncbi:MAG TPA: hypothetical protein VHM70_01000 [Polyangiaceae bacterium]|nr:hypothetical protein [Polyangiaceae bacterium]
MTTTPSNGIFLCTALLAMMLQSCATDENPSHSAKHPDSGKTETTSDAGAATTSGRQSDGGVKETQPGHDETDGPDAPADTDGGKKTDHDAPGTSEDTLADAGSDALDDAGRADTSESETPEPATADGDVDGGSVADAGELPEVPPGSVPSELTGVWQETRASASDYEYDDGFGGTFSLTSGFSVQLKLTPDGQFYFAHYSSGASSNCAAVSQLEQAVGSAVFSGGTLTLYPQVHQIEATNCSNSSKFDAGLDPLVLDATLTEDRQVYGGMRMYRLELEGYAHPLDLVSLFRVPDYEPFQPDTPADFPAVESGGYAELQGLWAADSGTDVDFFNPDTGEFYLPELNGSPHRWIRFDNANYETAVALQNVNTEGVCATDLIYYERGTANFGVTQDVGGQGDHFIGGARLDAEAARLIVNIRDCDEDNGVLTYDLQPLTSYYEFNLFLSEPIMLDMNCKYSQSEWQSLLCEDGIAGYYKR